MDSYALDAFARLAVRIWTSGHRPAILERIRPGELGCSHCGHVAPRAEFRVGKRTWQHVCPGCDAVIERDGYIDGDLVATLRQEVARC